MLSMNLSPQPNDKENNRVLAARDGCIQSLNWNTGLGHFPLITKYLGKLVTVVMYTCSWLDHSPAHTETCACTQKNKKEGVIVPDLLTCSYNII